MLYLDTFPILLIRLWHKIYLIVKPFQIAVCLACLSQPLVVWALLEATPFNRFRTSSNVLARVKQMDCTCYLTDYLPAVWPSKSALSSTLSFIPITTTTNYTVHPKIGVEMEIADISLRIHLVWSQKYTYVLFHSSGNKVLEMINP